jgi:hypothetical protein
MRREVTVHAVRYAVGRLWLLPPERARDRAIVELVACAIEEFRVELHAISVLGDRVELLMTGTEPGTRACGDRIFDGIAILLARDHGFDPGRSVWDGRARVDVVWGLRQQEALWDLHAGPVELGLVSHPTGWRGVTSARALVGGSPPRSARGKLTLTPLPVLSSLTRDSRLEVVRRMFAAIERGAREARRAVGVARHARATRIPPVRTMAARAVTP